MLETLMVLNLFHEIEQFQFLLQQTTDNIHLIMEVRLCAHTAHAFDRLLSIGPSWMFEMTYKILLK